MPYDHNGFNYQGESVLSLYDTSLQYGNSYLKDSGFNINGVNIATKISPKTYHSWHGSSKGTKTYDAYIGFGTQQISFDNAFSVTGKIYITPHIYATGWMNLFYHGSTKCIQYSSDSGTFGIYRANLDSSGSANGGYSLGSLSSIDLLLVGGGGGGKMAYFQGYGSGGPGGGGGGAVVTAKFQPNAFLHYRMIIGQGGNGQTSWTPSLAGYNAYDGGETQFYADGYPNWYYYMKVGGGARGRYMNEAPSTTATGSTAGAAPAGSNINESFYAADVSGNGYVLGQGAYDGSYHFNVSNINVYRNRGGHSLGYGWSGSGGGGAGGVGGVMTSGYNRQGGAGGSAVTLYSRSWGGGGGGGGDAAQQTYFANGAHGGGDSDGYGGGGNSVGTFTGTSDGKNGGILIAVPPSVYTVTGF